MIVNQFSTAFTCFIKILNYFQQFSWFRQILIKFLTFFSWIPINFLHFLPKYIKFSSIFQNFLLFLIGFFCTFYQFCQILTNFWLFPTTFFSYFKSFSTHFYHIFSRFSMIFNDLLHILGQRTLLKTVQISCPRKKISKFLRNLPSPPIFLFTMRRKNKRSFHHFDFENRIIEIFGASFINFDFLACLHLYTFFNKPICDEVFHFLISFFAYWRLGFNYVNSNFEFWDFITLAIISRRNERKERGNRERGNNFFCLFKINKYVDFSKLWIFNFKMNFLIKFL